MILLSLRRRRPPSLHATGPCGACTAACGSGWGVRGGGVVGVKGDVGGGGGSTSESVQLRPLMLPQEVEMLPENDLIVFRRGMYATYGKKVRYFAEKKLVARTKIPAPEMPTIRIEDRKSTRLNSSH